MFFGFFILFLIDLFNSILERNALTNTRSIERESISRERVCQLLSFVGRRWPLVSVFDKVCWAFDGKTSFSINRIKFRVLTFNGHSLSLNI